VIEKAFDELMAASPSDQPASRGFDPNSDYRTLQMWLEQLATALRDSSSNRKADALAALQLFGQDGH